jgi:hypothetical protein
MASQTQITKADAELVPALNMERLDTALAELKQEALELPGLEAKVDALSITGPAAYADAGVLLTHIRSIGKVGAQKINPFVDVATRVLNFLRTERSKHENQATIIAERCSTKMATYKRQEREAAEAEERKVNEERRRVAEKEAAEKRALDMKQAEADRKQREKEIEKARKDGDLKKTEADRLRKEAAEKERRDKEQAEQEQQRRLANHQDIKVKPNTPTVSGTRGRVNYYAEIVNEDALIDAWAASTGVRRTYLRQFIMVNATALGKEARAVKNSTSLNANIPGVRFTDADFV